MGNEPLLALVHGGFHGAWCWDFLVPELSERGFRTSAVDLPSQVPGLGASAYADVLVQSLPEDEDVVVIGHSAAGLVIPLLADRRRVSRLIFLAALVPVIGQSLAEQNSFKTERKDSAQAGFATDEGGLISMDPAVAKKVFYHDCSDEAAAWAVERLIPNDSTIVTETTPLEHWPSVPSSSIVCTEDRAIPLAQGMASAQEQLGATPVRFPGGHSPFLARPAELASVIEAIVRHTSA
jgi:pimeloyl-ACP methyl ester carboxylesterase